MAKRETNAGRLKKRKPKHYKRETNKERAVREWECRMEFDQAKSFAEKIREKQREGLENPQKMMLGRG